MKDDLQQFLVGHEAKLVETAVWYDGAMPLRLAYYLGDDLPPEAYISSVRAVLFRGDAVMVVRDFVDSYHVVPGGRCEPDETLLETLHRELLEETGWTLLNPRPLGFIHFHHLAPKPDGYAFPYPDFLQRVYVAEAQDFIPEAMEQGEYELETGFRTIDEALSLPLQPGQRLWLHAALR
ncbi:MAG: NUDIX hydrolase [Ardenticatenaceae bacterium]|nr:NUDIX hydrolase [Anaerolineales bacterium]MCB8920625.1 NUDIX hydrolase [Ardenticatenaceae bacterium]MCB8990249.1 NUDIX hydrolase [Ardenticatenaceae bacterium]MCB9002959.1 NUDIX hydrolase [Ardenticatenaceae bacterium]